MRKHTVEQPLSWCRRPKRYLATRPPNVDICFRRRWRTLRDTTSNAVGWLQNGSTHRRVPDNDDGRGSALAAIMTGQTASKFQTCIITGNMRLTV